MVDCVLILILILINLNLDVRRIFCVIVVEAGRILISGYHYRLKCVRIVHVHFVCSSHDLLILVSFYSFYSFFSFLFLLLFLFFGAETQNQPEAATTIRVQLSGS